MTRSDAHRYAQAADDYAASGLYTLAYLDYSTAERIYRATGDWWGADRMRTLARHVNDRRKP